MDAKKIAKTQYSTNAEEIMSAGAEAVMLTLVENPECILIEEQLTDLVARLVFIWTHRKENKE